MITNNDVELLLNPEGSSTKFKSTDMTQAVSLAVANAVSTVQAYMPEGYRRMQKNVLGLRLTREAIGGETSFELPSWLEYENGYLWRNLKARWRDRKYYDAEPFTYDEPNHSVVLSPESPASRGDVFVMEVEHSSAAPQILKKLCLSLAVNDIIRSVPRLVGGNDRELYMSDWDMTFNQLRSLRRGDIRINEWDDLDLIDELEMITPQGPGTLRTDGW